MYMMIIFFEIFDVFLGLTQLANIKKQYSKLFSILSLLYYEILESELS